MYWVSPLIHIIPSYRHTEQRRWRGQGHPLTSNIEILNFADWNFMLILFPTSLPTNCYKRNKSLMFGIFNLWVWIDIFMIMSLFKACMELDLGLTEDDWDSIASNLLKDFNKNVRNVAITSLENFVILGDFLSELQSGNSSGTSLSDLSPTM